MQSTAAEAAIPTGFTHEASSPTVAGAAPNPALTQATCLNCGASLSGAYCATCGQGQVGRITLTAFAKEVAAQLIEIDHGLLHTFVDLLRGPGATIRDYIAGRRRKYTSPVTYVLIASALSLLRGTLTPDAGRHVENLWKSTEHTYATIYSPAQIAVFKHIQDAITTNKFAMDLFLLVPIALSLRFLFRKQRINLAEMIVFTCFTIGQATLVSVVIGTPLMLVASASVESALFITASIGYLLYAGFGFFGRSVGNGFRLLGSVVLALFLADGIAFLLPFVLAR